MKITIEKLPRVPFFQVCKDLTLSEKWTGTRAGWVASGCGKTSKEGPHIPNCPVEAVEDLAVLLSSDKWVVYVTSDDDKNIKAMTQ